MRPRRDWSQIFPAVGEENFGVGFASLGGVGDAEKTGPRLADTASPPRNFTLTVEERLRAYAQGPPGYIRRRRRIEDLEARLIQKLVGPQAFVDVATSAEFVEELALLNDLIEKHNRYYPIEANLPIDVRTGRLIDRGAPWRPLPALSAADLLARAGG
jgi:hypothetical protein